MSQFIGYTVGLECWLSLRGKDTLKLVKVEFNSILDGDYIRMNIVSGHNLSNIGISSVDIHRSVYDARPDDSVELAIWALDFFELIPAKLGF